VIATGEKLSCILVVAALQQQGAPAELITLDDIVQAAYGTSSSAQKAAWENLGPRFFDPLATEIGKRVLNRGEKIPVIPGFFGSMPDPLITSVGRGYTDLCAAMCAAGLESHELQIWKDVDGLFTADPRKVKGARLLATVTMEEARELTECGSEVIHPFTMDQVNKALMPVRLKNVGNPKGPGTIIYPTSWVSGDATPMVAGGTAKASITSTEISEFMAKNGYDGETQSRRVPTALTSKESVVLVHVQSFREKKSHDFLAHVFKTLDEEKVDTDLVSTS
jgi:aspartate kinase